jgi:hypothetical protein
MCEGTSDQPLADIVEYLFAERNVTLRLSRPDFSALPRVKKDVRSKVIAGAALMGSSFDLAVVHRDADNAGWDARQKEILDATLASGVECTPIPVIPVRMTEAWLLLDEQIIRTVAGNPNGTDGIPLPKLKDVESVPDPKSLLRECLLHAASPRAHRRQTVDRRFYQHRRRLLELLDPHGPIVQLTGWSKLITDIDNYIEKSSGG